MDTDTMFQLWDGIWGDWAATRVVEGATCTAIGVKKKSLTWVDNISSLNVPSSIVFRLYFFLRVMVGCGRLNWIKSFHLFFLYIFLVLLVGRTTF